MRHSMQHVAGLALLLGCAGPSGLSTDQGGGGHAGISARATVVRTNVDFGVSQPGSPLLVWIGFEEGVTLAGICSQNPEDHPLSA